MAESTSEQVPAKIVPKSEDILGVKWDQCISDSLIKIGAGFGVGAIASLILFRRRKWPLIIGTGIGLGMGLSNCQHSLNNAFNQKYCSPELFLLLLVQEIVHFSSGKLYESTTTELKSVPVEDLNNRLQRSYKIDEFRCLIINKSKVDIEIINSVMRLKKIDSSRCVL